MTWLARVVSHTNTPPLERAAPPPGAARLRAQMAAARESWRRERAGEAFKKRKRKASNIEEKWM